MKRTNCWLLGGALLASLLLSPAARAQAGSGLSEAQMAYADVDYEKTRALAAAAIRRGGNAQAVTSELYLLWAIAAAALDQPDEARSAFSYALATRPGLKLERNLSPKIRAPYLEARGALSGADDRPPLEATLRLHEQQLELGLYDALHVAASLVVATRAVVGTPAFTRRRFEAAAMRRIAAPTGSELQFFVRVLDRYDNVLFELGSEDEPQRLVRAGTTRAATRPNAPASERARDANPAAYYVTSGALAVLGLATGGVATAMYFRREEAARQWNGSACERPGLTRAEQYAGVDERRLRAEHLAIGLTAAGGALLVGSLVSLALAPSSRSNVALDVGASNLMLRLRTTL